MKTNSPFLCFGWRVTHCGAGVICGSRQGMFKLCPLKNKVHSAQCRNACFCDAAEEEWTSEEGLSEILLGMTHLWSVAWVLSCSGVQALLPMSLYQGRSQSSDSANCVDLMSHLSKINPSPSLLRPAFPKTVPWIAREDSSALLKGLSCLPSIDLLISSS